MNYPKPLTSRRISKWLQYNCFLEIRNRVWAGKEKVRNCRLWADRWHFLSDDGGTGYRICCIEKTKVAWNRSKLCLWRITYAKTHTPPRSLKKCQRSAQSLQFLIFSILAQTLFLISKNQILSIFGDCLMVWDTSYNSEIWIKCYETASRKMFSNDSIMNIYIYVLYNFFTRNSMVTSISSPDSTFDTFLAIFGIRL